MSVLTIVIVNYNSNDFLHRCLDSLFENTTAGSFEVVIVDNASEDQDFSEIKQKYPSVDIILNQQNLGFAVACNQGLESLQSDYYLLLNPDCVVGKNAVDRCVDFLNRHHSVGIVGCRVNNPDGTLQLACRRRIPRPSTAFYRFSGLNRLFPDSPRFGAYNLSYLSADEGHEVEAVSGSFLMFRNQVYKETGGLDERFFLYGEDLDFCYRASLAGWKIFYCAEAEMTHYKGISSKRDLVRSTRHFYEAMETFYRKHFYPEASWLERLLIPAGIRLLYMARRVRQILSNSAKLDR